MRKILAVFFLVMAAAPAFAISQGDLTVRAGSAKTSAAIRVISDENLMNITYVGASTESAVGITSSTLITYAPIGTTDLSYNLAAAAYNTVGEVCDAIQVSTDYTCQLTGGKRDDNSTLLGDVTASASSDAKANGGYAVLVDTGGSVATDPYILTLGITPESGKHVILRYCIGNINVIDHFTVYGKLAKYAGDNTVTRNDTTKVYSKLTADDTDLTIGNLYGVPWLEFAKDAHVVIRSIDADSTQAAANFVECVWDEE